LQSRAQEAGERVLELEGQLEDSYREIEGLRRDAEDVQRGQDQSNTEELQHIQVCRCVASLPCPAPILARKPF